MTTGKSLSKDMVKPTKVKSDKKVLKRAPKSDNKKSDDIIPKNDDINNLSTEEIFRLADLHFNKKNYIFRHLYDSYNKFIEEDVKTFLENGEHTFTETITTTTYFKYRFKFENVMIDGPTMNNGIEPMFPSDARHNNYTYSVKLIADVTQYQDIIDIASDRKVIKKNGETEKGKHIATIPLMVRSKWCSLYTHKDMDKNECDYDAGGYFIVNGNEKVVICQDRMVENKPLVFIKKDSGAMSYIVQCNSRSYKPHGMTQVISVKMKKDEIMMLRVPILNEVNVCAVFRALGFESDRSIIDFIAYDEHDTDMIDIIRASLDSCKTDKGIKISSQEEAIEYLIPKLRVLKKYTETDAETKKLQKQMHLKNLLQNNFLPHVEGPLINKAYYLGYMLNRLLRVYLGKQPLDDRDSYINKRIDLPGDLMFELFKQQYKKLLGECKKFFDGRNKSIENPVVVITNIKPNIIEQGFKASLSTGHWIRRQGVAQMLQRLTYLQTISFLRRVDAPGGDASSAKLTNPRHAHPSSIPYLCCLTGDMEILMGDGRIELMKNLENGNITNSVSQNTLVESNTPITNFFSKDPEKLLEITTISGRKLKCTPDHPVLIRNDNYVENDDNDSDSDDEQSEEDKIMKKFNNKKLMKKNRVIDNVNGKYIMKNADELKEGDCVIIRHFPKYLPVDKSCKVILTKEDIKNESYYWDFLEAGLIDKPIPQELLEITARLIGASVTDGHISKEKNTKKEQYHSTFNLGEEIDAFELMIDIQKFNFGTGFKSYNETRHINKKNGKQTIYHIWKVAKGGAFAYYLKLMGAFVGDKTMQEKKIPNWILNGNKPIKREFLSGFHGGDGCRIAMQRNVNGNKLSMGGTCQTTTNEHLDSTIKYMESICSMFAEFGVDGKVGTENIKDDDGTIDKTKTKVFYYPSQSYENICKFANTFAFRYCAEKSRASAPIIEYVKYKNYLVEEKQEKYNKIIELEKKGLKPQQIVNKTGIEYKFVKRILENYRKGHIPIPRECDGINGDTMKYGQFLKEYYISDLNLAIPIKSIKEIPVEKVYDYTTVMNTHTIMANGICNSNCTETPEHAKVGLTKHLSMISTVTIMSRDQYSLLRDFLMKKTKNVSDVPHYKLRDYNMYKVFLNGDWIGMTDESVKLLTEMEKLKMEGFFDQKNVSIVPDHDECEIRIYCDSGRLVRPLIKVNDNELMLKKHHIKQISLNKADKMTKITDWDEFLLKNIGVIEYVDSEYQPFLMVATKSRIIEEQRQKMVKSLNLVKNVKSRHVDNRYDEMFYLKYTHCEIHPSLLMGEITTNVPFSDRNQGPRNIFFYAQSRQAMGIFATNYRDRLDISFILYYPQRPLVTTRTARYTNSEHLPAGENCIVAIACYTGYNQEDSLIFNRSSIERGRFRAIYLKKYLLSVQKNQSTSQDDIFMRPEPTKLINMKYGSYDKLNDKGYASEETRVESGDAVLGKVTPVEDPNNTGKCFKDSSETYKMFAPGVIDRAYIDIQNQDGYMTRKLSIRSERIPRIGDKYSSRHGKLICLKALKYKGLLPVKISLLI